jgi:anti-sigma B factor antagonist
MTAYFTGSAILPAARKQGRTLILSARGEIDLQTSPELRTHLLDLLLRTAPTHLVMNLEQVPYMDSSALAVLVEALQRVRRGGGKVVLVRLQPRVKSLLEIARLDTLFVLKETEAEGLEMLGEVSEQ